MEKLPTEFTTSFGKFVFGEALYYKQTGKVATESLGNYLGRTATTHEQCLFDDMWLRALVVIDRGFSSEGLST